MLSNISLPIFMNRKSSWPPFPWASRQRIAAPGGRPSSPTCWISMLKHGGLFVACVGVGLLSLFLPWYAILIAGAVLALLTAGFTSFAFAAIFIVVIGYFIVPDTFQKMLGFDMLINLFNGGPVKVQYSPVWIGVISLFAVFYWLRHTRLPPGVGYARDAYGVIFAGLIIYSIAGLLWSPNLNMTLPALFMLLCNFFAYKFVRRVASNLGMQFIISCMSTLVVLGVLYAVADVIVQFLRPSDFDVDNFPIGWFQFQFHVGGGQFHPETYLSPRFASLWMDHHTQGGMLNAVLAMVIGLGVIVPRLSQKLLLAAAFVLILFADLLTDVRGGFLALLGMMGFLVVFIPVLRRHPFFSFGSFALLFCIMITCQISILKTTTGVEGQPRILTLLGPLKTLFHAESADRGSSSEVGGTGVNVPNARSEYWDLSIKGAVDSQWLGIGVGNEENIRCSDGVPLYPHSLVMSMILDYGAFGLAAMLLTALLFTKQFLSLLKTPDSDLKILAIALCGSTVTLAITGLTFFTFNCPILWITFGLTQGAIALVLASGAAETAPQATRDRTAW